MDDKRILIVDPHPLAVLRQMRELGIEDRPDIRIESFFVVPDREEVVYRPVADMPERLKVLDERPRRTRRQGPSVESAVPTVKQTSRRSRQSWVPRHKRQDPPVPLRKRFHPRMRHK